MSVVQMYYSRAVAAALAVLMSVQSVSAQSRTRSAIELASARVSAYLTELAEVTCAEKVSQEKLTPNGKMELHQESQYDYLVMIEGNADEFMLNESRILNSSDREKKNLPLLVTNGFSTLFLIFHPYYRDGFSMVEEGEVMENGQRLAKIRFQHIRGKRTPTALEVRGREYPLEIMGTAWVAAQTGSIVRIEAGLAEPMDDIGLRTLTMQVNYTLLKLAGSEEPFFYPASVYVEVETRKQRWRNIHLFTNYKRFGVSTEVAVSGKKE